MLVVEADRTVDRRDRETAILRYRCREASAEPDAASRIIDTFSVESLLDLLSLDDDERAFREPQELFWFADGWQSWSPGWEVRGLTRRRRSSLLPILDRYIRRDRQRAHRGELIAQGTAYLRRGDRYLALLSLDQEGPPVSLRVDRRGMRVAVELYSNGARFAAGDTLAELVLLYRRGHFAFSDAVASVFRGHSVIARADFLARGGGRGPTTGDDGRRVSPVGGWCSWYRYHTKIDEAAMRADLDGLVSNRNVIRELFIERGDPALFQIDDGWERAIGEWTPHPERFPSGMKELAGEIAARGLLPGLWVAPFLVAPSARLYRERPDWLLRDERGKPVRAGYNPGWEGIFYCLDLSIPAVRGYLRELFDRFIDEWGYRYLKLDFLYAGMLAGKQAGGPAYRWYREALAPIVSRERNRRGEPIAFLGCGAPFTGAPSLFPLMRIGADTLERWDDPLLRLLGYQGRPSALINLRDTIARAFTNGSLFRSDPDVFFLRSRQCRLSANEKELIAAVAIMFGSQLMTSDDYRSAIDEAEARLTDRVLALHELLAGREYAAVMIEPDLWRCFSRDGAIAGVINLRSRSVRLPGDGEGPQDELRVAPRSIAVWRVR